MSNVNFDTFYLTGDVIVRSYEMTTTINDDLEWLNQGETNQVVGRHFTGDRWTLNRAVLDEINAADMEVAMVYMNTLKPEDHLTKVVEMYELMHALPVPVDRAQRKTP